MMAKPLHKPPEKLVLCSVCGASVGTLVTIEAQEWLCTGGLIVRSLHGVCAHCGSPYHWVVSDHMLAEMIRHVLEMRERIE